MKGLLVAGTDTGVGKTFVAAALCRALRRSGRSVVGLKPFETGCTPVPHDAELLEREARSGLPLDLRCPFRYREAIAPAAAAKRGEVPAPGIGRGPGNPFAQALGILRLAARSRVAIVECAGGLYAPLDGTRTNLDLASYLGLPVILVARNALGTQNHTTLSVEALRHRRLKIAAIVLSRGPCPPDPSQKDNAFWIARLTGVRRLVELPRTTLARASRSLAERLALSTWVG